MSTDIPIRTYTKLHKNAGTVQFSIPVMNLFEVEAYLQEKTCHMDRGEAYLFTQELMKHAKFMWDGYALWVGDPDKAREELQNDEEVRAWYDAK